MQRCVKSISKTTKNNADPSPPIVLRNDHSSALKTSQVEGYLLSFFKVIPYHVWSSAYGLNIPTNTLPSSTQPTQYHR
ncbi:hypothetical protein GHT06_016832 [Daphnia sinensis]|uniref:Uncharacterized protein n=1 Tax=Daphnia sinensis TaxID=1820382 RepID=A0AAD5L6F1_9CRUS|nr:hypothetical protein GHT06_016832 [Daphnia sinensis]